MCCCCNAVAAAVYNTAASHCRCVQHVKLFTSKNNSVLVGKADLGAELYTPQRNRPDGMLVAIRGFQDKATYKGGRRLGKADCW